MANDGIPDFQWARFYYFDQLAALIRFKSGAWPEHTETDPHDPVIQLLRLFALVGHQQAARLDHTARELYLPTARLRQSFIGLGALVDYQLALAVPATTDVLADLNAAAAISAVVVRAHSIFATEAAGNDSPVLFEYVTDDDLVLTKATGAWGFGDFEQSAAVPAVLEEVADHTGGEVAAVLWAGTGAMPAANRGGLLWWHPELQFNKIDVVVDTPSGDLSTVRWEYYDDSRIVTPDTVADVAGDVVLGVSTLVGSSASTGLDVLVTSLRTGVQQWVQTDSSNNVTTSGSLGQSSISTNPADYTVQTFWPEPADLVDGTSNLSQSGAVTFTLPQTATRRWARVQLEDDDGDTLGPAYFLRARIIAVTGTTRPVLDAATEAAETTWTAMVATTQGQRVVEKIGTTDAGTASQSFDLGRGPLLSLTSLTLSDGAWTRVDNFLASSSYDRHFTLLEQPDGTQRVTFGNGTSGKIPPASSAVTADYRVGAEQSGNVGATAVRRDRTGNTLLTSIRNPRDASGWVVQEGTTEDSRELLRAQIPASVRTLDRAVTPEDFEYLATQFRTAAGAQVAERVLAIQEGLGPKTVKLVIVGPGGIAPTQADLNELDDYFNGELVGLQRIGGAAMANTETTGVAFTGNAIDVTATVDVLAAFADGAASAIQASLEASLQPNAKRLILDQSGVWVESSEYLWSFGGEVGTAFLLARIITALPGVVSVSMSTPATDVALASEELPIPGTITLTIVPV